MMYEKIFIANWKMNKTVSEALSFVEGLKKNPKGKVMIAAPYTLLTTLKERALIGAQNMHEEEGGAFTGEISGAMLKDAGAQFVLLGHSERRHYFHESNALINQKIKAALHVGLLPILCIGETLDEHEDHETETVLKTQLEECLEDIPKKEILIAYEPVWAIGTGVVATSEQASRAHAYIRHWLEQHFHDVPILYGGSVKPDNIQGLLACKDVDGVLVGGASLNVAVFNQIIAFCT